MIETTVSRRRELASGCFLKEGENQRGEREVRRHGFLAYPVAYDVTGHCHSPSVYLTRGHGNPSIFLLYSVGGTVPEHHSVRRLQLVRPPLQDPIQGDAVERAGQGGFPGGNREKERKREEKELRKAGKAAGVKPIISQNLQLRQLPQVSNSRPLHRRRNRGLSSAIGPWSAVRFPVVASKNPDGPLSQAHQNQLHRPLTFRTTSRHDGSTPTHDICIRFQEPRLDDARRPSVCIHSKQTADAQRGSFNSSPTPCGSPSGTRSHPKFARTVDIRVQAHLNH